MSRMDANDGIAWEPPTDRSRDFVLHSRERTGLVRVRTARMAIDAFARFCDEFPQFLPPSPPTEGTMMRAFFALLIAGGCASGLIAEDAPPTDRLKLLRQVVEQLEAAGESDLAGPVRLALLRAASQQSDLPGRFVLQVTALEIDRARLAVDRPELAAALYLDPSTIPAVGSDRELLRQLEQLIRVDGPVNVVAEPSLAATAGKLAMYRQGGEFEIPIPASHQRPATTSKKFFGSRIDATVKRRDGRFHVELMTEFSRLDPSIAVMCEGKKVPGLTKTSFEFSVESWPGETQLVTRRIPGLPYLLGEKKAGKASSVLAVFLEMDVEPAVAAASSPADALKVANPRSQGHLESAVGISPEGQTDRIPKQGGVFYSGDEVQYMQARSVPTLGQLFRALERYELEHKLQEEERKQTGQTETDY